MAGQTPSRRQLLQAFACATLASGAPGFVRWSFAFPQGGDGGMGHHQHGSAANAQSPHHAVYRPVFFGAAEYATVEALTELILPRTGPLAEGSRVSPHGAHRKAVAAADAGATDAGVAEFIDFMAMHDVALQEPFRNGLRWLEGACPPDGFVKLKPAEQQELLGRLAFHARFRPEDKPGQDFFALVRRYTAMGFYTTKIGLEQLDYPGLQFYGESPSVPADGSLDRVLQA